MGTLKGAYINSVGEARETISFSPSTSSTLKTIFDVAHYAPFFLSNHALRGPKCMHMQQTMTEAKHNRPIPKLFNNRPSVSATEVFVEIIRPIIEEAWLMKS